MLPPLPERMRPKNLSEYVGQRHLVGEGCILRKMIENGNLSSFILWGPPGVGKTTLAGIIAQTLSRDFYTLSAVSAGVKDVRDVIDKARGASVFSNGAAPILVSGDSGGDVAMLSTYSDALRLVYDCNRTGSIAEFISSGQPRCVVQPRTQYSK